MVSNPPRTARRCTGCGHAVWSSFSRVIWGPRRAMRFATTVLILLIVMSILVGLGVVVVAAGLPPESMPRSVVLGVYAALGGFAGLLLRIVSPTAGRIALTALAVGSIVGVKLFETWFLLVITREDAPYFRPPDIPLDWAFVQAILTFGLLLILPIATGLISGIALHDAVAVGIRTRRRGLASPKTA